MPDMHTHIRTKSSFALFTIQSLRITVTDFDVIQFDVR